MMNPDARSILEHLEAVARLRRVQASEPVLRERVHAMKVYQHARFAATYADLLRSAEHAAAARFFLDELYGPHDFTERDAQFARIVPALVRLFPRDIVATVRSLAELHALSERLDAEMAGVLDHAEMDLGTYRAAWQRVGRGAERQRQIDLMLQIGRALVRFTRNPVLRHSLRLMRGPAKAAGLGALQHFLERGFDTFGALRQPEAFLALIAEREQVIARWLFDEPGDGPAPPGF